MHIHQIESQHYHNIPTRRIRERPLHWFIILISYLFIFLLVLESVAFIVLGAWHLTIPRLENVRSFSDRIYRRELGFGILLVIIGSLGILISIIGIIATITLRVTVLRIVSRNICIQKIEIVILVCFMFMGFNDSWCNYWNYWYYIWM